MKKLIALSILFSASVFGYTTEDISYVCKGDLSCINIVNEELMDISIKGNYRIMTPDQYKKSLLNYCKKDTPECFEYIKIMIETYDQAYKEGNK